MQVQKLWRSARRTVRPFVVLVFVAASVLLPRMIVAQSLTGALVGTVTDEQGGVLPGASVRVSSPALIGGSATATTSEKGQLRFPVLAPGLYVLDVTLQNFAPYHEENIYISAGTTLERTVVLKLEGVATSIVVEGSGSRIEARGSGFDTRIGPEYLKAIPTRRFSMFDAIRAAPGMSPTSPSSGTVNTVSAFGSNGNENLFLIDGTNFTCPCSGHTRAEPSVDVIQEVQVQSVGVSAEFGNIQGSVFNVVTRQGGERLHYDASYYGQWPGLTSQPILRPVSGQSSPSGYERAKYSDFTTNLGGPAVRDRLWYFGGYQRLRDYDSQPGTDPAFPRTYQQDKIFAKLTWRLTPNLQLMQSIHEEFWVNPEQPTFVKPFEATTRPNAKVPAMTFADLTHTLSPNTLWNIRVGRFVYDQFAPPSTGDLTTSNHFDQETRVNSFAPQQFSGTTLIRTTAKGTLTHYRPALLGADHEWKVGTQFERGQHYAPVIIPGGIRYVDNAGQPFQAVSAPPSNSGGLFNTVALFVSDSVTIGRRLTVNAGIRFDHSRAISQDIPATDANGNETDGVVAGLGPLYSWNVISPRLGITQRLTADGRTILRASYGRFNQGVMTGEISPIHPGVAPETTTQFDPTTGGYTQLVSVVTPSNILIDQNTRTPRTDEYSIGVDRELGPRLSASVAYIHKNGDDFIAWTDVGGQYREDTHTLPDGRILPVFVLTNGTASRRFLLTNPDGFSLKYNGLVTVVEKRYSNGWQALGSYTFSRTTGLLSSSGALAGDAQLSTVAGLTPIPFGRDPNNLTNAYGRLPNDRPHMFRLAGAFDVPRTRLAISANLQYFSGKPWAASALRTTLQPEGQRILLEPRGTRRLSSQSLLDFRISRPFDLGDMGSIEVIFDVLNLLNDTAEEALATDNQFSPTFGQPTVFVDPRRAMVGVRLNLGGR
jgi:TonB dependent receptor-like, beta-barrel/Carboxypeptidase regulatory-like domain